MGTLTLMSSMLIQPCTHQDYRAILNIENEIRLTRYIKLTALRVDKKQKRKKEIFILVPGEERLEVGIKCFTFLIVHSSSQRSVPVFCMHK